MIGISGSLIWLKTPMELIFNPCDEFRRSPEGPVSQIHSPHLSLWGPWDLFRFFKFCSDANVDPGGPVVIVLASGSERFAGSIPAGVDGFFSECKNPAYFFLRKGSKAVAPVS